MDADEIAVLSAGLGQAIAQGLVSAHQTEAEAESMRRLAQRRANEMDRVIRNFERERECVLVAVTDAVAEFCRNAKKRAADVHKYDPRVPCSVNYLERYNALVGVQDRATVLKRLGETIEFAGDIIRGVPAVDMQPVMQEIAAAYAESVAKLNGITVAAAAPAPPGELGEDDKLELPKDFPTSDVAQAMKASFDEAFEGFSSAVGEQFDKVEAERQLESENEERIDKAVEAAKQVAQNMLWVRSCAVAGEAFDLGEIPAFCGKVSCELAESVEEVRALYTEVQASFKTFCQVVQDNGLFAAFASEGTYGGCRYRYGWLSGLFGDGDGEGSKHKKHKQIPTAVEEDKGGDDVGRAVERMREFNRHRYWGMLDDDFQRHIDAFWYGFKKLMENVNNLFDIDAHEFDKYCTDLSKTVQSKAAALAENMTSTQAEAFEREIVRRMKSKKK